VTSLWLTFGLVGLGYTGGLFPELRLGLVAVGWCRGAIGHHARAARGSLEAAVRFLKPGARP
jgi:hypothetical protein